LIRLNPFSNSTTKYIILYFNKNCAWFKQTQLSY